MKKIRVCNSRSCTAFGARRVMEHLEEKTGLSAGTHNEQYDLDYCGCLGWCSNSPNVEVDDERILFEADGDNIMQRIHSNENSEDQYLFPEIKIEDDFLGDI